jgi:hypothetical protein
MSHGLLFRPTRLPLASATLSLFAQRRRERIGFLIEAIKRGIPAKEIPVTVQKRLHGHSKKPAVVRYGLGFSNAIVRTWLR